SKGWEIHMEQILINLVAGALGGVGVGKSSPTFDLGMIGNIISGLIGGGVLGQIVTLFAAGDHGRRAVGPSERRRDHLTGDRRRGWRRHTHGDHWRNQEQSCCLTGSLDRQKTKSGNVTGVYRRLCNDRKIDLPRSPYCRGAGSNLEIFSKAMAINSAA